MVQSEKPKLYASLNVWDICVGSFKRSFCHASISPSAGPIRDGGRYRGRHTYAGCKVSLPAEGYGTLLRNNLLLQGNFHSCVVSKRESVSLLPPDQGELSRKIDVSMALPIRSLIISGHE